MTLKRFWNLLELFWILMKLFQKYILIIPVPLTLRRSWLPEACDPVGSVKHRHEQNPFIQWPIAESWTSISVPMITRMIFKWTFGYHEMFPLLRDTLQNPMCIDILLGHHHAHYTVAPVTGFVLLSRWRVLASPWRSHLCLARRWWMPSHREGPKNISPSSEEQIPPSSCSYTC